MKVNQTKAIVACLGIAAAAAIAGSVSGTVAWFQYNTRVTAAYVGTSASTTSNLEIKVGDGQYKQKLTSTDIGNYLTGASNNAELHPVTLGVDQDADAALPNPLKFYSNPLYQYFEYGDWNVAPATAYVQLPLKVKYTSDAAGAVLSGRSVWLTDLTIQNHVGVTGDLYKALRVHVSAANGDNHLFSSEASQAVTLGGALDLNNDGENDIDDSSRVHYDFVPAGTVGEYGNDAYKLDSIAFSELTAPTDNKGVLTGGDPLGATDVNGELAITVTIWLEGWQELTDGRTLKGTVADLTARDLISEKAAGDIYKVTDADPADGNQTKWYSWNGSAWAETTDPEATSAIWDKSYIGKQFDVGFRFSVSANA